MAEGLKVRVRVRVSPGLVYAGLVAFCLLAVPAQIVSESVALQTFYPAPSAVYQDTLTSQQTWLARDSGYVGIGIGTTAAPPLNTRLVVMDNELDPVYNGRLGIGTIVPRDRLEVDPPVGVAGGLLVNAAIPGVGLGGPASPGAAGLTVSGGAFVLSSAAGDKVLVQQGVGGLPAVTANGGNLGLLNPVPATALDVGGAILVRGCQGAPPTKTYGTTSVPYGGCLGPCTGINVTGVVNCPGGHYATWIAGVMSDKQTQNVIFQQTGGNDEWDEGSGTMFCCPCPGGACPSLP